MDMDKDILDHLPSKTTQRRACKRCALIKTLNQFLDDGCENCGDILHLKGNRDNVMEYTSPKFSGMIAMIDSKSSWVSAYMHIGHQVPGIYAVSVSGTLPQSIIDDMKHENIPYRCRDLQNVGKGRSSKTGLDMAGHEKRSRKEGNGQSSSSKNSGQQQQRQLTLEETGFHTQENDGVSSEDEESESVVHEQDSQTETNNEETNTTLDGDGTDDSSDPATGSDDDGLENDQMSQDGSSQLTEQNDDDDGALYMACENAQPIVEDGSDSD